jgi:hypothetical protein
VETCKGADEEPDTPPEELPGEPFEEPPGWLPNGVVVDLIVEVVVGGVAVAKGAVTVAIGVAIVVVGETVAPFPVVWSAIADVVVVVPVSSARICVLVYTTSVFGVDVLGVATGAAIGSQDWPIVVPPICWMIVGWEFK